MDLWVLTLRALELPLQQVHPCPGPCNHCTSVCACLTSTCNSHTITNTAAEAQVPLLPQTLEWWCLYVHLRFGHWFCGHSVGTWTSDSSTTMSTPASQTWHQEGSVWLQLTLWGKKRDQEYNHSLHHCRHPQPWLLNTPSFFVHIDLSWWSCMETMLLHPPWSQSHTPSLGPYTHL